MQTTHGLHARSLHQQLRFLPGTALGAGRGILLAGLFVGLILGGASCMTQKLWEDTDPNEWVRVGSPQLTESVLREKGIAYQKTDGDHLFIQKTTAQKMRDYHLRALGAPVTVVVDAASTVGTIVVIGVLEDLSHGGPVTESVIRSLAH